MTAETLPDDFKQNLAEYCECMSNAKGDDMAAMKCFEIHSEFTEKNNLNNKEAGLKYRVYFQEIAKFDTK